MLTPLIAREMVEKHGGIRAAARAMGISHSIMHYWHQKNPVRTSRKVVAMGDLHCGHRVGLTPPSLNYTQDKWSIVRDEGWKFYTRELDELKPIDTCLVNGDIIDGRGKRSGGTELLLTDVLDQVKCAIECLQYVEAKNYVFTYGTPYHTGEDTDYERLIAESLQGTIGGHQWVDINGVIFDLKHKVGSSSVPHGRHTATSREHSWNVMWADRDASPKSDILLRSHVHYHQICGGAGWLGMTLPALQGLGSKYGVRQCSGVVDYGFISFDVWPGGYSYKQHIMPIAASFPQVLKV